MQPHKFSHSFNKYLLRTFMKDTGTEIVRISKINTGNLQQSEKVEKNSERLKKTKKVTQEIDLSQFNLRYLHVYKAKHLKLLTLTRLFINVVFVLRLMYNNYTHFWSWCDVFMHIHWATMTTSGHLFYLSHWIFHFVTRMFKRLLSSYFKICSASLLILLRIYPFCLT